jgi:hypothetical protein
MIVACRNDAIRHVWWTFQYLQGKRFLQYPRLCLLVEMLDNGTRSEFLHDAAGHSLKAFSGSISEKRKGREQMLSIMSFLLGRQVVVIGDGIRDVPR